MTPGEHVTVAATKEPVAIWSGEHNAWWRANRSGYCIDPVAAGLYSLADAIKATHHVGPEKRITIVDAPTPAIRSAKQDSIIVAAGMVRAAWDNWNCEPDRSLEDGDSVVPEYFERAMAALVEALDKQP